ncbi:biofilm regulation protein phosphatase SiaA [Achromobacter aloeverae]|uniref:Histidine kinase n=1 Tax=Achromobacter aloeverae TaxID=1750518 RepID=A0A4Q1HEB3_9BURK|nr:biofilm regulation protein phosphatase SiaA [Achromobacter aloeverae]RXN84585.1 histidine kinase [Achromobacter aloeverae]
MAKLGLRAKSLLALILACLLALIPTVFLGWHAMEQVREHFGRAYADNFALLSRQRILAPVSRELALSQRLAYSEVTRLWLQDEDDPARRAMFFREAEGYRRDFRSHSYFLIVAKSGNYYFNDDDKPYSDQPRYTLSAQDPNDNWFYSSIKSDAAYNINVNPDAKLHVTRVWFNIIVREAGKPVAITGAGLDLSDFLREFVGSGEPGVTPMIIDAQGAIQAHPDPARIAYNSGAIAAGDNAKIYSMIGGAADKTALQQAMDTARREPAHAHTLWLRLQGKRQLVSVAYVPELNWYVLGAVDLHAARVVDMTWVWPAMVALLLLVGGLLLAFGLAVNRLVLRPIRNLQQSARAIADGRYDVTLPAGGADEVGDLSRAFGVMAAKVRSHTAELESKVRERTVELEAANRAMAAVNKKLGDSIDYASLIQQAILPDRQMAQSMGLRHFVMWKPRDVVGGDFYVFRADGENFLLGVMDCAGHGVPGALMTMLVRAAVDVALAEVGPADPAAVLVRTDRAIRAMLRDAQFPDSVATSTDAGLVYIDRTHGRLLFAGAKISLYESNGDVCREHKGVRRALGEKRQGDYTNLELPLTQGSTFYLTTDGFLDQAGGELGYGFGGTRFAEMLRQNARLPLSQQCDAFEQALAEYRGNLPQRDDITILSFRFE